MSNFLNGNYYTELNDLKQGNLDTLNIANSTTINSDGITTNSLNGIDSTEIGYLSGVTSSIQDQINSIKLLGFNFRGTWNGDLIYNLNDVVSNSGNAYICIAITIVGTDIVDTNFWNVLVIGGKSLNPRGSFNPSLTYLKNDIVSYNNSSYICIKNTNAGTVITNTEFWSVLALKGTNGIDGTSFTYKNTWSDTTAYVKNDVVSYDNSSYLCIQNAPSGTLLTNTEFWSVLALKGIDGTNGTSFTYKNTWVSTSIYAKNDVVSYDNSSYLCIKNTLTGTLLTNTEFWSVLALKGIDGTSFTYRNTFDKATTYSVNDVVLYNGSTYICTQSALNKIPTSDITYWSVIALGFTHRGDHNSNYAYNVNDLTGNGGTTYICTQKVNANQNILYNNTLYWRVLANKGDKGDLAFAYKGNWVALRSYQVGDVVNSLGNSYICTFATSQTVGSPPNTDYWGLFTSKGDKGDVGPSVVPKGAYISTTTYNVNDLVFYENQTYICKSTATNQIPYAKPFYWSLFASTPTFSIGTVTSDSSSSAVTLTNNVFSFALQKGTDGLGINAKGNWSAAALYVANDIVYYNGLTYICLTPTLTNHVSPSSNTVNWANFASAITPTFSVASVTTGSTSAVSLSSANAFSFTLQKGADGLGVSYIGVWSASTTYQINQVVTYNNSSYIAIVSSLGIIPGSDVYKWGLMALKGVDGIGLKGDPGSTPSFEIGTVRSGSSPSVTLSDNKFNFVLQQGPKGDPGQDSASSATGIISTILSGATLAIGATTYLTLSAWINAISTDVAALDVAVASLEQKTYYIDSAQTVLNLKTTFNNGIIVQKSITGGFGDALDINGSGDIVTIGNIEILDSVGTIQNPLQAGTTATTRFKVTASSGNIFTLGSIEGNSIKIKYIDCPDSTCYVKSHLKIGSPAVPGTAASGSTAAIAAIAAIPKNLTVLGTLSVEGVSYLSTTNLGDTTIGSTLFSNSLTVNGESYMGNVTIGKAGVPGILATPLTSGVAAIAESTRNLTVYGDISIRDEFQLSKSNSTFLKSNSFTFHTTGDFKIKCYNALFTGESTLLTVNKTSGINCGGNLVVNSAYTLNSILHSDCTATTQDATNNTTKLATTAFVKNQNYITRIRNLVPSPASNLDYDCYLNFDTDAESTIVVRNPALGTTTNTEYKSTINIGTNESLKIEQNILKMGNTSCKTNLLGKNMYFYPTDKLSVLKSSTSVAGVVSNETLFEIDATNKTVTGLTPLTADNSTMVATTAFVKNQNYITGIRNLTPSLGSNFNYIFALNFDSDADSTTREINELLEVTTTQNISVINIGYNSSTKTVSNILRLGNQTCETTISGKNIGVYVKGSLTVTKNTISEAGSLSAKDLFTIDASNEIITTLTPPTTDNSTKIATTAFVNSYVSTQGGVPISGETLHIGFQCGQTSQGTNAIAIGYQSGQTTQGTKAIAMGYQSGQAAQGTKAMAMGFQCGLSTQGESAIAIGNQCGQTSQKDYAIAIGYQSGATNQGTSAVAIGYQCGLSNQGQYAIAMGYLSGQTGQNLCSVAIGYYAASNAQGSDSVAIGNSAGQNAQGIGGVAIGKYAGSNNQSMKGISIGFYSAQNSQGESAIAIGNTAGSSTQGSGAVALGYFAGQNGQGTDSVAIGNQSARKSQGASAIAIGEQAGMTNQGQYAIAIGYQTAPSSQSTNAIAIGLRAGKVNQGESSIAIGQNAGTTNQHANSIILNASGSDVNTTVASSFCVKPIRNLTATNMLFYNNTSSEITYGALDSTYLTITNAQSTYLSSSNAATLYVDTSAAQTIGGAKTFSNNLVVGSTATNASITVNGKITMTGTPSANSDLVTLTYANSNYLRSSGYASLTADQTISGKNTFSGQNTFSGLNTFSAGLTLSGHNTFSAENDFSRNINVGTTDLAANVIVKGLITMSGLPSANDDVVNIGYLKANCIFKVLTTGPHALATGMIQKDAYIFDEDAVLKNVYVEHVIQCESLSATNIISSNGGLNTLGSINGLNLSVTESIIATSATLTESLDVAGLFRVNSLGFIDQFGGFGDLGDLGVQGEQLS